MIICKLNTKNIFFFLIAILVISCETPDKDKLFIVATTGMIGDAVKQITGDSAEVFTLMGPGVDPHLYKPAPRDVDKLAKADIIVYNGLHLEGKMGEILQKISRQKKVIAVSEGIPRSKLIITNPVQVSQGGIITYDPHIWFDVALWQDACSYLGQEIQKIDTSNALLFKKNTDSLIRQLQSLDQWTQSMIRSIPPQSRVLITAHDAFNYFEKAYNIQVMSLQGTSTITEPGLKDISSLVNILTSRKIKAVFVESSVSEKSILAVVKGAQSKGHTVTLGGTLFSDAMGAENTPEGTYIGMVRHNVNTIVKGLK